MKNFADCHIHIRGGKFDVIENMLDEVASKGVTDAGLMALPYRGASENLSALYFKANYKKMNVSAFGGVHSTDQFALVPYEKQAEKLLDMGCDGIKLIDMDAEVIKVNGKCIDHVDFDKMFSLLEERDAPVLIHAGNPQECWEKPIPSDLPYEVRVKEDHLSLYRGGLYGKPVLSFEEIYAACLRMLDKHPNLKVIFAHFFFLSRDIDEATRVMETYPNVYFDLTPGTDSYVHFSRKPDEYHDFFEKYSDRILFGTDTNTYKDFNKEIHDYVLWTLTENKVFTAPCYGFIDIHGLGLSDKAIENICYNNYIKLVGKDLPKVDMEKVLDSAEYMLSEINKNPRPERRLHAATILDHVKDDLDQNTARTFFEELLKKY